MAAALAIGRNGRPRATACPQGHAYTEENTAYRGNGVRYCRICNRLRLAASRTTEKVNTVDWDDIDDCPFLDDDWTISIIGAMFRQALADFLNGYTTLHTPDAAAFLRSAGVLRDDGTIDTHGHKIPARGIRRQG